MTFTLNVRFAVLPSVAGDSRKTINSDSKVIPNNFWVVKRVAKDSKRRVQILRGLSDQLIQMAVNNGDEETYKRAHARLSQAKAEVLEMIEEKTGSAPSALLNPPTGDTEGLGSDKQDGNSDGGSSDDGIPLSALVAAPHPPVIPVKNRKQRAHDNAKNNSALCRSGSDKTKGKKGKSKSDKGGGTTGGGGIIQRRRGGSGRGKKSGRTRQNPLVARLNAQGQSQRAGSRNGGVGDFNMPGYECSLHDVKPEGVPAETAAIESHNIPRDDRPTSAI